MGIVEIGGIGGAVAMQDELGLKGMRDFEKRKKQRSRIMQKNINNKYKKQLSK